MSSGIYGDIYGDTGGAPTPPTPTYPTVNIITSPPITPTTPIVFDAFDSTNGMRLVFVYVIFPDDVGRPPEVVHDGTAFAPLYSGPSNSRVAISGGYEFTILRNGGWPRTPRLVIIPVNTQGNLPL